MGGEVLRALLEPADARSRQFQRASSARILASDELQPTPDDFRHRLPSGPPQPFDDCQVFGADPRMDIGLHTLECITKICICAT